MQKQFNDPTIALLSIDVWQRGTVVAPRRILHTQLAQERKSLPVDWCMSEGSWRYIGYKSCIIDMIDE